MKTLFFISMVVLVSVAQIVSRIESEVVSSLLLSGIIVIISAISARYGTRIEKINKLQPGKIYRYGGIHETAVFGERIAAENYIDRTYPHINTEGLIINRVYLCQETEKGVSLIPLMENEKLIPTIS